MNNKMKDLFYSGCRRISYCCYTETSVTVFKKYVENYLKIYIIRMNGFYNKISNRNNMIKK